MTKKFKKTMRIPEGFTKCGLPFGPIYNPISRSGLNEKDSFCGRGLNKAGVLILVKGEKYPILIGHINKLAGTCGDCTRFKREAIVIAYRVIWQGAE